MIGTVVASIDRKSDNRTAATTSTVRILTVQRATKTFCLVVKHAHVTDDGGSVAFLVLGLCFGPPVECGGVYSARGGH